MDKIEKLRWDLEKIKESFDLWKNSGLNEEVLVIYLMQKTKLTKHQIKSMLTNMNVFFDDLITKEVTKEL